MSNHSTRLKQIEAEAATINTTFLIFLAVGAGFYCENLTCLKVAQHSTHFGTPNYNTYTLHNARATVAQPRGGEVEEDQPFF